MIATSPRRWLCLIGLPLLAACKSAAPAAPPKPQAPTVPCRRVALGDPSPTDYQCPDELSAEVCKSQSVVLCHPVNRTRGTVLPGGVCRRGIWDAEGKSFELNDDCAPIARFASDDTPKGSICVKLSEGAGPFCTHNCETPEDCTDVRRPGFHADCRGGGCFLVPIEPVARAATNWPALDPCATLSLVRAVQVELLSGAELYQEVVLRRLAHARESVWIATANVKAMLVQDGQRFRPVVDLFDNLASRGVDLRLLHAELPSRPFRAAFDRREQLVRGGLALKICPRVHFKAVLVDGAWAYLGSANLTGAGLGAKGPHRRNFELGFVTEDFDVIDQATALFESIWSGAECASCQLRDVCPDPLGPPAARPSDVRLGRSRRMPKNRT